MVSVKSLKKLKTKLKKKLKTKLKKKVENKNILKKSKTSYKVPDKEIERVWEDDNKFFKGTLKNEFI